MSFNDGESGASVRSKLNASLAKTDLITVTVAKNLDNIEDGATADQTGAEIVDAIDAQLGSSVWQGSAVGVVNTFHDASVDDEGAAGDGSTDDTAAFQAAIDALPTNGGVIKLNSGANYIVTIGSLSVGAKNVLWVGAGAVNGAQVWTLPGVQQSWSETLGRAIYNKEDAAALDASYKDNRRNADYTGGNGGDLDYIETWQTTIASTVGSAGNRKAEKAVLARVDNFSDHANGIASFAAAFAEAQGAVWARENSTHSKVTPTTYAHRSVESNIHGYGPDPNRLRRVESIIAHNETVSYSGTPGTDEVGVGLEIYPDSADFGSALIIHTLAGAGTTRGTFLDPILDVDVNSGEYARVYTGDDATHTIHGCDVNTANAIVVQRSNQGGNSIGGKHTYAQTRTVINDPTDGSEDGTYQIYVSRAGALVRVASFVGINGDIEFIPQGTGDVSLGTMVFDSDAVLGASQDQHVLTYDQAAGKIVPSGTALQSNRTQSVDVGFSATTNDLGTVTTGTVTPDEADGAKHRYVNDGAHALDPPANDTTLMLKITNGASAGAIDTSDFDVVDGDPFTTANGDIFLCGIEKIDGTSLLVVRAV